MTPDLVANLACTSIVAIVGMLIPAAVRGLTTNPHQ